MHLSIDDTLHQFIYCYFEVIYIFSIHISIDSGNSNYQRYINKAINNRVNVFQVVIIYCEVNNIDSLYLRYFSL